MRSRRTYTRWPNVRLSPVPLSSRSGASPSELARQPVRIVESLSTEVTLPYLVS